MSRFPEEDLIISFIPKQLQVQYSLNDQLRVLWLAGQKLGIHDDAAFNGAVSEHSVHSDDVMQRLLDRKS